MHTATPATRQPTRSLRTVILVVAWIAGSSIQASAEPPRNAGGSMAVASGWSGPVELIDEAIASPVPEISTAASPSAVHAWGGWHVVYASLEEIWLRAHTETGWKAPVPVSLGSAPSRDPHITLAGGGLLVVWEDERTGVPEIWCRRLEAGAWSPEACLSSDDAVPSRRPAAAGNEAGAYVVWEDGVEGERTLRARAYFGGQWREMETPVSGAGEEYEPAVSYSRSFWTYVLTWSDTRLSRSVIYALERDAGGPWYGYEYRISNHAENCGRSSVTAPSCCGNAETPHSFVVYEREGAVTEIYGVCAWELASDPPLRCSPDDGISSLAPCAASFDFAFHQGCDGFVGHAPKYQGCWSDGIEPGTFAHSRWEADFCPSAVQPAPLASGQRPGALLAASHGSPDAQLIALWVEDRDGTPTLVARRSTAPGCWWPEVVPPEAALLSPEGTLATVVGGRNHCGFEPMPGVQVRMDFSACPTISWDDEQPHPVTENLVTDEAGEAPFHLRGGGCVRDCLTRVHCHGVPVAEFRGVRSPDVDGDCLVGEADRAYFVSMLGTGDYCADLDGSGTVDDLDLQIVDATFGERCSQISGLALPRDAVAGSFGLRAAIGPNPCSGPVRIALVPAGATLTGLAGARRGQGGALVITDVSGRCVRSFALPEAGPIEVLWDTRDARSRPVPAGVYRLALEAGGMAPLGGLVVLR